ncbi:MAG: VCBS repeat-containing protein [Nannocystaceae bacterium]
MIAHDRFLLAPRLLLSLALLAPLSACGDDSSGEATAASATDSDGATDSATGTTSAGSASAATEGSDSAATGSASGTGDATGDSAASESDSAASESDSDTGDTGEPPVCDGFDAGSTWALPDSYAELNFVGVSQAKCDAADNTWHSLLDLTGDGALDLVITNVCDGSLNPGTDYWLVHPAEAGGFAAQAIHWSLPAGYADLNFIHTSQEKCDESDSTWHAVLDVNGDARPDLVVRNLCDGSVNPGSDEWLVYLGEADGFAATATPWALPSGYADLNFIRLAQQQCDESNSTWHSVRDVDGDARPDLIVSNLCDGSLNPGTSEWRVYYGGDEGFAASAVAFPLPKGFADQNFIRLEQQQCDESNSSWHSLFDLNGDGALDLIIHNVCDGSVNPGTDEWQIFPGNGDGFGNPSTWPLPNGFADLNFIRTAQAQCDESNSTWHSLLALNGDRRPDLVITNICDGSGEPGTETWDVYPNTGASFAAAPIAWSLPSGTAELNFISMSQAKCDEANSTWHSTVSLTGGPAPDLVVTNVCDGSVEPGTTSWQVFSATCTP